MPKSKEFLKNVPETWKEIKDLPFSIGAGRAVSSELDDQTKVLNKLNVSASTFGSKIYSKPNMESRAFRDLDLIQPIYLIWIAFT